MSWDERIERARLLYERAVFGGEADALASADRELDAVEADLALARGRIVHARYLDRRDQDLGNVAEDPSELGLFERATRLYQSVGDERGEGEALFWVGCFHQVVRGDDDTAVPVLERSLDLASRVDDRMTMSYALRHLGIADHHAGRLGAARERLEESVRLRRGLGFLPGVAANLIGLAYLASGEARHDESLAMIEEAGALAEASDARGILRSVEDARAQLVQRPTPS